MKKKKYVESFFEIISLKKSANLINHQMKIARPHGKHNLVFSLGIDIFLVRDHFFHYVFMIIMRDRELKKEFNVIVERDSEGFYVATVPDLPGCHTQAKSLDDLMKRIRETIELCLEVTAESSVESLEFVGFQRIILN